MRVVSGIMKGKRLLSLKGDTTRPTLDRIKENIFNIIQFDIEGKTILDLFSGSGQMAIEGVSRGAKKALLFEIDKSALNIIKKNIEITMFEDKITLVFGDYKKVTEYGTSFAPFEIVFLDPPYKLGLVKKSLELLSGNGLLSKDCIVVAESGRDEELPAECNDLKIAKVFNYGNTKVTIYRNSLEFRV